MNAEIVTIGDELCRGEVIDTNSSWLAEALWDLDITVAWTTSCRDVESDIREAIKLAANRTDLVLVSGGLGPTVDDMTVDVVAGLLGTKTVVDEPSRRRMEERYKAAQFRITPNNIKQLDVPSGASVMANPVGAAPGFEVALDGVPVICMPGVPREMKAIFDTAVRDRVLALRESRGEGIERIARRIYRTFGAGESHIASRLENLGADLHGFSLHFQAKFPEVLVKVVVRGQDQAAVDDRLATLDIDVRAHLGSELYGLDDDSLAAALGRELSRAGVTLATAESCTGGLVGALITEVPGSSAYYHGGAVTYSNDEKMRQLGVREQTLIAHGAVSEACVIEMAEGARRVIGTDYGVAISGVAGPGGGTPEKPVGTVWLAMSGPDGTTTRLLQWPGTRSRIRERAAYWALTMVLRAVRDGSGEPARDAEDQDE